MRILDPHVSVVVDNPLKVSQHIKLMPYSRFQEGARLFTNSSFSFSEVAIASDSERPARIGSGDIPLTCDTYFPGLSHPANPISNRRLSPYSCSRSDLLIFSQRRRTVHQPALFNYCVCVLIPPTKGAVYFMCLFLFLFCEAPLCTF